ncbi:hypothetical protein Pint_11134 [Pistacia integerrima]|uniref:Uncharacterized protein n=1 Tax=Pistacia integerrima TaxID=434235 RepID=A0ACC0XI84_9ROSI|nr:hypothetical protein Pint_11134 [Pistacia integerrima]
MRYGISARKLGVHCSGGEGEYSLPLHGAEASNLCAHNDCTLFSCSICSIFKAFFNSDVKLVLSFKFKGSTKSVMQWGSSFVCCSSRLFLFATWTSKTTTKKYGCVL